MIETSTTAPDGSGRVISAQTVAANRHSSPQLRGLKRACGSSQTAPATARGTNHRHRAIGPVTMVFESGVVGGGKADVAYFRKPLFTVTTELSSSFNGSSSARISRSSAESPAWTSGRRSCF